MAVVVQRPDNISLSGNMKDLILQMSEPVTVKLGIQYSEGNISWVIDETYYPGNGNLVHVDFREVVEAYLSFTLPSSDVYIQPSLSRTFTVNYRHGSTEDNFSFIAVRAGKLNLSQTAESFLTENFLTWQPNQKAVTYYSPEWLTYFSPGECFIKLKAYWEDTTSSTVVLASPAAGTCYTVNLQYAVVSGKFSGKRPMYYDVWVENAAGNRLSYIQRYVASEKISDDENWYLFENSLGGLDSLRAHGSVQEAPEYTFNAANFGEITEEYRTDTERKFVRNTGLLTADEARWLQDLFPANKKYIYTLSGIYPIVFTDSSGDSDSSDYPSSYTFTYRLASTLPYLDIQRRTDLPEDLIIPVPTGETFFLPPRLAEFPKPVLSADLLIPVQEPHTEVWGATSIGVVKDVVVNELVNRLDGLDLNPSGGGGSSIVVIKTNDLTTPTDSNVFSALRTLKELDNLLLEASTMFLRKDIPDIAHAALSFDERLSSTVFIDGADGKGWEINPDGDVLINGGLARADLFVGGKFGSIEFAPGFPGYGVEIDMPSATATFDNVFIRKNFSANTITYSQIYGIGGSQIVSDLNKISRVVRMSDRWRCFMDSMEGLMRMNLRVGDGARIQSNLGTLSIKYVIGRIIGISSDYFDIAYPMLEGTGEPSAGDFVLRWGNNIDTTRQGLIYSTTSDPGAPFTAVYDGITDISTEGKLKVLFGNVSSVRLKNGRQLKGYGAYLNGIWIENSQIFLENGDTIEQNFFAMNGKFESLISEIKNDMSVESGNVLVNSSFSKDLRYWTLDNTVHFINVSGAYLWMTDAFYVEKDRVADIYKDGSRNVLRIKNTYIIQPNSVLNLPERETVSNIGYTYSFSFYYKVLRPGTLYFGIPGSSLYIEETLDTTDDYQRIVKVANWNEKGDFSIQFTGEILIYSVSLFNDALADAQVYLQTQINQNKEAIKLMATKEYVDGETGKIYIKYDAELKVQNDLIGATVIKIDNINNRIDTAGWITEADGNTLFAAKSLENGDKIISYINQSATTTTISSSRINLIGAVSFQMFDTSLQNTINGKLTGSASISENKLSGVIINGQTLIAGGYIQANFIKADEIFTTTLLANIIKASGLNINDKFIVDKEGFVDMQGKFTASYNGNKIIINPSSDGAKITGIDSNGRTVMNIGFSYYEGVNAPLIEMVYYNSSGQEMGSTRIAPDGASFRSRLNTGGMSTMTIGRSSKGLGMTINATFPTYAQASYGDLYVDGDDVVRIRQEW